MPISKSIGVPFEDHPIDSGALTAPLITEFTEVFPFPDGVAGIKPGQVPFIQGVQGGVFFANSHAAGLGVLLRIPDGVVPDGAADLSVKLTFVARWRGVEANNDTVAFATGTSSSDFTSYGSLTLDAGTDEFVSSDISIPDLNTGVGFAMVTPTINPASLDTYTELWSYCAQVTYTPPPPEILSISAELVEPTAAILSAVIRTYEVSGTTYLVATETSTEETFTTAAFGTVPPAVSFPSSEEVVPQYQLAGLTPDRTYDVTVFVETESGSDFLGGFQFTTPETPSFSTLIF